MKKAISTIIAALVSASMLLTLLSACGKEPETAVPSETTDTSAQATTVSGKQEGDRFEGVITLEGFEETVKYEHIRNSSIGIEMDYDYELFVRQSQSDCERIVSVYDDPVNPEIYLEVTARAEDAETVAASISDMLSQEFDVNRETYALDYAGECIHLDASSLINNGGTPDNFQAYYIIPAADGCRVAATHYTIDSADGFGKRFRTMIRSIEVISRQTDGKLTDEQALSAIEKYLYASNPDLENIIKSGEYNISWGIASSDEQQVVVLYRSYTGAEIRYYIDRNTGETYVTEFVPGITAEEQRTDETFNIKDYLG